MLRILTWLTLIAAVFAAKNLVTTLNTGTASYAAGTASTGQTQPTIVGKTSGVQTVSAEPVMFGQTKKTFEQQCEESLPSSLVKAVVQDTVTVRDYSKDVATLTNMAENTRARTLGLTVSYPQVNIVWNIETLQDNATGRVCMRPQFYISVNAGTQNVYVAKEFLQNTCAFNEILAHELRHVETNRKIANTIAENMKTHIEGSIENRIIYGKNRKEVEGYVVDAIEHHWLPFAKENFSRYKKLHREIDSNEEYYRVYTSCNGEIPAILETKGH